MKIPLKLGFPNTDGSAIRITEDANAPVLTMKDACIVALTNEFPEDQNPSNIVQDKLKRFALYQKFLAIADEATVIELDSEDASYLKPRIARCFGMLVSGPALMVLDGKAPYSS